MQKNGQTKIGEGSFGNVRLISHIQNSTKLFALKTMEVIDDLEEKYIKQEIDLHISLNHKNIIKLVDYFFEDKIAYIILEYAAKGDLFHYLHRTSNIPQEQLEKIFVEVLEGFSYLHEHNIMHRDLKPENILLDENYTAKICDFGWSTKYNESEERETLCGTAEYMAPEIIYGKIQTVKTDVWALGKKYFVTFDKVNMKLVHIFIYQFYTKTYKLFIICH